MTAAIITPPIVQSKRPILVHLPIGQKKAASVGALAAVDSIRALGAIRCRAWSRIPQGALGSNEGTRAAGAVSGKGYSAINCPAREERGFALRAVYWRFVSVLQIAQA